MLPRLAAAYLLVASGCSADVATSRQCSTNNQCAADEGCRLGICRPACADGSTCAVGFACTDGYCVPPICGNGVVEPPEACDGNCPTACPTEGCEVWQLQGSAAACTARCALANVAACGDGGPGGDAPAGDPPPNGDSPPDGDSPALGDPSSGGDPGLSGDLPPHPPLAFSGTCSRHDNLPLYWPELHIVGVYQAGSDHSTYEPAAVHVDRQGEVIVVLSAYEQVAWTVTAAAGTTILRVILTGNEQHSATVPTGTTVEDRSGANIPLAGGSPNSWGTGAQAMAEDAAVATGTVLSAFVGCYEGDNFVIGRP